MIRRIRIKLINKKYSDYSDFSRNASNKEKEELIRYALIKANKEQRHIVAAKN